MHDRKWPLARLIAALLVGGCSTSANESPKGDASVYPAGNFGAACTKAEDCTGGGWCDFPTTGGCGATGVCAAPHVAGVTCVGTPVCPCDGGGVMYEGCGSGFPATGLLDCAGARVDGGQPEADGGDAGDAGDAADAQFPDAADAADASDGGDGGDAADRDASDAS